MVDGANNIKFSALDSLAKDAVDACAPIRRFLKRMNDDKKTPLESVLHDNAIIGGKGYLYTMKPGEENRVFDEELLDKLKIKPEQIAEKLELCASFFDKTNCFEQLYDREKEETLPTVWGAICMYRDNISVAKLFGYSTPQSFIKKSDFDTMIDDCLRIEIGSITGTSGKNIGTAHQQALEQFRDALKSFYIEEVDPKLILGVMQRMLEGNSHEKEREEIKIIRNSCSRICGRALEKLNEQGRQTTRYA